MGSFPLRVDQEMCKGSTYPRDYRSQAQEHINHPTASTVWVWGCLSLWPPSHSPPEGINPPRPQNHGITDWFV